MQNLAVHWHEGLFLRPQHLQAWDRHWHERSTAMERWGNPHNYGIASIRIQTDALAAGFFQLESIRCKMPEGTLVELVSGEATDRRDLREAFIESDRLAASQAASGSARMRGSVDVYLGIPRFQLGVSSASSPKLWEADQPDPAAASTKSSQNPEDTTNPAQQVDRFQSLQVHVPDEVDTSSVEPILVRRVNARILLSTDDLDSYEVLKIARVRRGSDGGEIARIDTRYLPPILTSSAWAPFRNNTLFALHDQIYQRIEWLTQLIQQNGIGSTSVSPNELRSLMLLQTLNQAAATLDGLKRSSMHPEVIYLELARICGSLDLFASTMKVAPIPEYDHDDLGSIFATLKQRIESRIAGVGRKPYQQRLFVNCDGKLQVKLHQDWFASGWKLALGVRRGSLSDAELETLLLKQLDWKLGSASQVEALFRQRVPGVNLSPLKSVASFLPPKNQWSYFEFDHSSAAWEDAKTSATLAIRYQGQELNSDSQPGDAGGSSSQSIAVPWNGEMKTLQFAVFAYRSEAS